MGVAIKMLERAGLLTWVNRLARIKVYEPGLGWRKRVIRTSNSYAFADPKTADRAVPDVVRPRMASKTETPTGTATQDVSLTDAPQRRDFTLGETPLEAALERLRSSLQQHRGSTT